MSILKSVNDLRRARAHIPETHVLQVGRYHDCLGPGEVNVVDAGGTLSCGVLAGSDVPGTNSTIITCRD